MTPPGYVDMGNFLVFVLGFFIFEVIVALIILFNDIRAFLFPHNWLRVGMKEKDRNIREFLVQKNDKNTFSFKKKDYNLYYPIDSKAKPVHKGRLQYFFFHEDDVFPVDMDSGNSTASDDAIVKLTEKEIALLYEDDSDLKDFLQKNLIAILAIAALLIIVIAMIIKGQPPATGSV